MLKTIGIAAVVLVITCYAAPGLHGMYNGRTELTDQEWKSMFAEYKMAFQRNYRSAAEEAERRRNFIDNMKTAMSLQMQNPHAVFGMNEFSDVAAKDFKKSHHNLDRDGQVTLPPPDCPTVRNPQPGAPAKLDWRALGAVTSVKNQGQCGSCWAFSAVANIEGQWYMAGHNLTNLSEQEVVSCDTVDMGCEGGWTYDAYGWMLNNTQGQIATYNSYPYESGNGSTLQCLGHGVTGAQFQSCEMLPHDEYYMANWTATYGPISICIDATTFQSYKNGIITKCSDAALDHCVLIAGYDTTNNPPYWIVKNSWGTTWGEEGYAYVEMYHNECMLANLPTSVVVKHYGPTPPPPPPTPAPPAPTPPPNTWTSSACKDPQCNYNCKYTNYQDGHCNVGELLSGFTGTCNGNALTVNEYDNMFCAGTANKTYTLQTNVCYDEGLLGYVSYACNN